MTRTLALTTGPSSSINAASARPLADTSAAVLMACRVDRLQDLADELRKACTAVKDLRADLSTREGFAMMRDRLSTGAVRLLISNVGVGGSAPLIDVDAAETDGSFTLNTEVHVQLAGAALPGMLAAADSPIASLPAAGAGRAPQHPVHRGQAATVAFAGICTQVLRSGPVATEFHQSMGQAVPVMAAEDVARAGLTGRRPGETICVSSLEEGGSAREGQPGRLACGKQRRLVALFNQLNGDRYE
ncbi:SDR family NAD(P)-dependent oxidoreductase [Streptomyces sviceus]|uniref:SDR family NAD(P)-dependent oxidoreductase n=1 Tax=Streptomyces sviceus TaxID=285530 RepID=UPI00369084D5